MRAFNFIPREYAYKKNEKIVKAIRIVNIILLAVSIYSAIVIYRQYIYYEDISSTKAATDQKDAEIKEFAASSEMDNKDARKASVIYSAIKTVLENRRFETMEINKSDTKIRVVHTSLEDYILFVKSIESGTDFEIIDLQPPVKSDECIHNLITIRYLK